MEILLIGTVLFTSIPKNVFAFEKPVERLWGNNRYETAKAISSRFSNSEVVILVTGENYPDALTSTPLAKKYDDPILLTEKDKLNINVLKELQRLNTKKVIIVGGTGVVGEQVEKELKRNNIYVERIEGKDRYDTSIKVAKEVGLNNGVFVATGEGFADALGLGTIAGNLQMPIILTAKNSINKSIEEFLNNNIVNKSYIVGGVGVVSNNVANNFPNSERIEGKDRYETNKALINKFKDNINFSNGYVAIGTNFLDALAGGSLAVKNRNPIILTSVNPISATKDIVKNVDKITVLGGEGVISQNTINKLLDNTAPDVNKPAPAERVYVTKYGKAFHRIENCSNMKKPILLSREEAISKGYKPCGVCEP